MRYLLDTHTFIWLAAKPDCLSGTALDIVADTKNELLLSAASGWETALLWKLNRIELPQEPALFIPEVIASLSLTPTPINFAPAIAAATLPFIHRDPFDRLLVATALQEKIAIISKDRMLVEYGVEVVW